MMIDIRGLVQTALDNTLKGAVKVFWQRKKGADADEYIVFTLSGDSTEFFADNEPLVMAGDVTVRYFYRDYYLDDQAEREHVKSQEKIIQTALEGAGFVLPFGKFDAGDVDNIGYFTTVFECEFWRNV
ncbi:MAG: hypothetical protein GX808_04005 [Syntrophomonadaceae bacterium]|jgi:hypothetical protein|nr:hypothetical protein [Syntrophomonadaceae bacterium]